MSRRRYTIRVRKTIYISDKDPRHVAVQESEMDAALGAAGFEVLPGFDIEEVEVAGESMGCQAHIERCGCSVCKEIL